MRQWIVDVVELINHHAKRFGVWVGLIDPDNNQGEGEVRQ